MRMYISTGHQIHIYVRTYMHTYIHMYIFFAHLRMNVWEYTYMYATILHLYIQYVHTYAWSKKY